MVHHIVMFRCAESVMKEDAESVVAEVKYQLELLPALIPEIIKFEVRLCIPFDSYAANILLISEFDDAESLLAYQQHPAHLAFVAWNRNKCPKISAADYIV